MTSEETTSDDAPSFRHQLSDSASRFPIWISLFVLSLVCLVSMILQSHRPTSAWGWAIAVTSLSMICSLIGYAGYLKFRAVFMGQLPELYLAGFVLLIWVLGLPVIMNPRHRIAVSTYGIVDANIYFSSWGALICSMFLCGKIARDVQGVDIVDRVSPIVRTRQGKWYMLVFAATIVLICSVHYYVIEGCGGSFTRGKCGQIKYGISAGVIGTGFAAGITIYSFKMGSLRLMHEWSAALIMVIIFSVALGFVTTAHGPASAAGNLYFSTWASFVLSVMIFSDCHMESISNREQAANAAAANNDNVDDLELQDADETNHQTIDLDQ
eukprot:scaffold19424_cov142-Cylindrotheca_fusiformis.AAC.4